jgi:hypothetical protein
MAQGRIKFGQLNQIGNVLRNHSWSEAPESDEDENNQLSTNSCYHTRYNVDLKTNINKY